MLRAFFCIIFVGFGCASLQAQTCDPSVAPDGLSASYTVGTGVLLQWNPVPGSVGVSVRVTQPSGTPIGKRIVAPEVDQLLLPELILAPGNYTWRVQAACSTVPHYEVTTVSEDAAFTVPGSTACSGDSVVVDMEGNVYSTVQIGSQCWMRENLKTGLYANGDSIPTGLTNSEWSMTVEGASCSYSDLEVNEHIYGKLYNWYAVEDPRSLCPAGWHVPTDAEWDVLTDYLGGENTAGGAMKTTGTTSAGTGLWLSPNKFATNLSGFTGLPAGYRFSGSFFGLSSNGRFWSSTERSATQASNRVLYYFYAKFNSGVSFKPTGYSVRCVRD